jgi:hypothetical protein
LVKIVDQFRAGLSQGLVRLGAAHDFEQFFVHDSD